MKAKITEQFVCYVEGQRTVFDKNAIVEGWPAKRAIAARKAVPYSPRKQKAPEDKVVFPVEVKDVTETP